MRERAAGVRYALLTYRWDQVWLPAALGVLFIIVAGLMGSRGNAPTVAGAFLGAVLPLTGGVLAAYAVLDDPALELHLASPRPAWRMLAERLGMILGVLAAVALVYQTAMAILGVPLAYLGSLAAVQLAWLAPCVAMIALGSAAAMAVAQPMAGALIAGVVWIVQALLRSWFAEDLVARYFFLFLGVSRPTSPALLLSQGCLLALAAILVWGSWRLLKKQERYL